MVASAAHQFEQSLRAKYGSNIGVRTSGWEPGKPYLVETTAGQSWGVPESQSSSWTPPNLNFQDQPSPTPTMEDVATYDPGPYENPPDTMVDITPEDAEKYEAPDEYRPAEEDTVEGRMTGLLETDSPYITRARTRAKLEANKRGLLNSTMAGTAGEAAAIDAALPIAQQDSSQFHEAGMAGYQGRIQGALSHQAHTQNVSETGWQAKYSAILADQEFRQKDYEAWKEIQYQAGLLSQEGGQQVVLERIRQKGLNDRTALEHELARELSDAEIEATNKKAVMTTIAELGDNYQARLISIQSDPNLDADQKAALMEQTRFEYEQNVRTTAAMYGVEIDWLPPEGGGGDGAEGGEPTDEAKGDPASPHFDGGEYREDVPDWALDYMDSTPGSWSAWYDAWTVNNNWTVSHWAQENARERGVDIPGPS